MALYWISRVFAILDNATLAAAEISPVLSESQIKKLLMALLISGRMLIPESTHIYCAEKLDISIKERERLRVPFGFLSMIIHFVVHPDNLLKKKAE